MWEIWNNEQYVGTTESLQIAQIAWEKGLVVYHFGKDYTPTQLEARNLTINSPSDILEVL